MMRSLFAGASGLKGHQTQMDVIGNNIANINTAGFKASRVSFKEIYTQTLRGAGSPQGRTGAGGTNPQQIGLGMSISSIDTFFTQGAMQTTENITDIAIQGEGFFVLDDGSGHNYYTRNGAFEFDGNGRLVNPSNGYLVRGKMADPLTGEVSDELTGIQLPFGQKMPAKATSVISYACNLNADAEILGSITKTDKLLAVEKSGDGTDISDLYSKGVANSFIQNLGIGTDTVTFQDGTFAPSDWIYADASGSTVGVTLSKQEAFSPTFDSDWTGTTEYTVDTASDYDATAAITKFGGGNASLDEDEVFTVEVVTGGTLNGGVGTVDLRIATSGGEYIDLSDASVTLTNATAADAGSGAYTITQTADADITIEFAGVTITIPGTSGSNGTYVTGDSASFQTEDEFQGETGRYYFQANLDGTPGLTSGLELTVTDSNGSEVGTVTVDDNYTPGTALRVGETSLMVAFDSTDALRKGEKFYIDVENGADPADFTTSSWFYQSTQPEFSGRYTGNDETWTFKVDGNGGEVGQEGSLEIQVLNAKSELVNTLNVGRNYSGEALQVANGVSVSFAPGSLYPEDEFSVNLKGAKTYTYVKSDTGNTGSGNDFQSLDDLVAEINADFADGGTIVSLDENGSIQVQNNSNISKTYTFTSTNTILEKAFSPIDGSAVGPNDNVISDEFSHIATREDTMDKLRDQLGNDLGLRAVVPISKPSTWSKNSVASATMSGEYQGSDNDTWTVKIGDTSGTIGTDNNISAYVYDSTNTLLKEIDLGSAYTPGSPVEITEGVKIAFDGKAVAANDFFTVQLTSEPRGSEIGASGDWMADTTDNAVNSTSEVLFTGYYTGDTSKKLSYMVETGGTVGTDDIELKVYDSQILGPTSWANGSQEGTSTSDPTLGGIYTGLNPDHWTVEVTSAGTVGEVGGPVLTITDSSGATVNTLTLDNTYTVDEPITIAEGVTVTFDSGSMVLGDTFELDLIDGSQLATIEIPSTYTTGTKMEVSDGIFASFIVGETMDAGEMFTQQLIREVNPGTTISIDGEVGGEDVETTSILIGSKDSDQENIVYTLGAFLDEVEQAYGITNASGVSISSDGAIVIEGDAGKDRELTGLNIHADVAAKGASDIAELANSQGSLIQLNSTDTVTFDIDGLGTGNAALELEYSSADDAADDGKFNTLEGLAAELNHYITEQTGHENDRVFVTTDSEGKTVVRWINGKAENNSIFTSSNPTLESMFSSVFSEAQSGTIDSENFTIPTFNAMFDNTAGNWTESQEAKDATHSASIQVYDAEGNGHTVTMKFKKSAEHNSWRWEATCSTGINFTGNTGTITFNSNGTLAGYTYDDNASAFTFDPANGAVNPVRMQFNFGEVGTNSGVTQYGSPFTTVASDQDGYAMGNLDTIGIDDAGRITGSFTNGVSRVLAQLALANFNNPGGLVRSGENMYAASSNSGTAVIGEPGTSIRGTIVPKSIEMSNVDLAQEFTSMIVSQRGFQANSRVITTTDTMLEELTRLKR